MSDDAHAIIEYAKQNVTAKIIKLPFGDTEIPFAVVPKHNGQELVSVKKFIDEYRTAPERYTGMAVAQTLESFIAYCQKFGSPVEASIFADSGYIPSIKAVLNYNTVNNPGWKDYGIQYFFPRSQEWNFWMAKNGQKMTQDDLAAFIEDRIMDIIAPPSASKTDDPMNVISMKLEAPIATPGKLLATSRGIAINVNEKVANAVSLSTGEVQITYEQSHSDKKGQPINVPKLFLIGIPVFLDGPLYRLAVRLRYTLSQGEITWRYDIYQPEKALLDAFKESVIKVEKETVFPTYYGAPA